MRRLPPILALAACCLLLLPADGQAQARQLWPGVTFTSRVQFTVRGPVVIHVLRGPRPNGTTTLQPVLSDGYLRDRETVTEMTRRAAPASAAAGVNGDYFNFASGRPTGIVMREGQLVGPPAGDRSSAGVLTDGTLDIRRVEFFGEWQGAGQRRTLNVFNKLPEANQTALFTSAFGPTTPQIRNSRAVLFFPFPAAVPNVDLEAVALEVRSAATPIPIPPGGAVLLGRDRAAAAVAAEAPVGQVVRARLILQPDWPGVVAAIGGGPQLVRDGRPLFRAGELFTNSQLRPRVARTAVGQLRNGSIVLVAVDGAQPGYSVGYTNWELAQALVRLGAVTAMALDGGGSTAMAFDGTLLTRPSGGAERPVATALAFLYNGIFVPQGLPTVSPNGDGIDDDPLLSYRIARPSTVTLTLTRPDGGVEHTETVEQLPGTHPFTFPPDAGALELGTAADPRALPGGRWRFHVSAVDDLGETTSMARTFKVNTTLGALAATPPKAFVPPGGREIELSWELDRRAYVVVTIVDRDGKVVRTLATRRYDAGEQAVVWNGLGPKLTTLKGGMYRVRVVARNQLGTTSMELKVPVRNIAKRPAS